MKDMYELDYEEAKKPKVMHTIPFSCKIGQIKAKLDILIETDPIGNGKGTAAHYHAFPSCPKIDRGTYPYRCMVTKEVCPFWEPYGGYEVEPYKRSFIYIYNFIRSISFIEFWGQKILLMIFKSRGVNVEKHHHISLMEVIILLRVFELIDKNTYSELIKIKNFRDGLLHTPKALMDPDYDESTLSKIVSKAKRLEFKIIDIFRKQEEQLKQKTQG